MRKLLISFILILAQSTVLPKTTVLKNSTVIGQAAGGPSLTAVQILSSNHVSGPCSTFTGNATNCIFPTNTAAGNTIIGCATWHSAATGTTLAITDSQSLTWSVDASTRQVQDTNTDYAEIGSQCFHSTTTTSAAAETVHITPSSGFTLWSSAFEIHGSTGVVTFQAGAVGSGTGATISTASITPSQNNGFVITISGQDNGTGSATTYVHGTGYTINGVDGGGSFSMGDQYQSQTTATAVTGNMTTSLSTGTWVASEAVYIP